MTSTDNTNKAIQLVNKRLSIRDANSDGKVNLEELKEFYVNDEQLNCYFSKKELNEMAGEYFTELDRNGDGYIKMSENSEAIKCLELANTRPSIRDRNGDGVVTLSLDHISA
ncbi:EF-hand domain-containing protein [Vibrio sp. 10N.286.46.E10]|uniref:EF-hand domain-containing protein n=1 Tax=unclassified Vibrio TaxID=2614977 RepID=UPI000D34D784|nr:EF-hand domain-containing protein [Vibrio sp. 10N.286.46.E10]